MPIALCLQPSVKALGQLTICWTSHQTKPGGGIDRSGIRSKTGAAVAHGALCDITQGLGRSTRGFSLLPLRRMQQTEEEKGLASLPLFCPLWSLASRGPRRWLSLETVNRRFPAFLYLLLLLARVTGLLTFVWWRNASSCFPPPTSSPLPRHSLPSNQQQPL